MKKVLHIIASPRGADSKSKALPDAYVNGLKENGANVTVETIELWQANLPEFGGDKAAVKMTFFGDDEMNDTRQSAWDIVTRITQKNSLMQTSMYLLYLCGMEVYLIS